MPKGPRWSREQILEKLESAAKRFHRWRGTSPDEMIRDERAQFDEDYFQLERVVVRAIRAGITNHAVVNSWITNRRVLGDYHWLRKFQSGLETDLPGSIDEADLWIALHAVPLRDDNMSLEHARLLLLGLIEAAEWPEWLGSPEEVDRLKSVVRGRLQTKQNMWQRLAALGIRFPSDEPDSQP